MPRIPGVFDSFLAHAKKLFWAVLNLAQPSACRESHRQAPGRRPLLRLEPRPLAPRSRRPGEHA